jgi:hypothetical protein
VVQVKDSDKIKQFDRDPQNGDFHTLLPESGEVRLFFFALFLLIDLAVADAATVMEKKILN